MEGLERFDRSLFQSTNVVGRIRSALRTGEGVLKP